MNEGVDESGAGNELYVFYFATKVNGVKHKREGEKRKRERDTHTHAPFWISCDCCRSLVFMISNSFFLDFDFSTGDLKGQDFREGKNFLNN